MTPQGVPTPALVVDVDRLQSNVRAMADAMAARGIALRPHVKTHKAVEIARLQLEAGAVGLTVATLGEAEVMAAAGCRDLFVAYPLWAGDPLTRLRLETLTEQCSLAVGVDSVEAVEALAPLRNRLAFRLEIDCGQHRTGVPPAGVVTLAKALADRRMPLGGIFTHGGHAYRGPTAVGPAASDELRALGEGCERLETAGFRVPVVSAGSTPTVLRSARDPVTEQRPGTYVFSDRQQQALGPSDPFEPAAWVLATVVSRSVEGQYVVDAGSKALCAERPEWLEGFGEIRPVEGKDLEQGEEVGQKEVGGEEVGGEEVGGDGPGAAQPDVVVAVSEHHGLVRPSAAPPALGTRVAVLPNHICPVVNLYDEMVVVQDGTVVDRWRIAARGR